MKPTFTGVVLAVPVLWLLPEHAATIKTATARAELWSRRTVLISETSYHAVESRTQTILARATPSGKRRIGTNL
jgi:hypothetical protein